MNIVVFVGPTIRVEDCRTVLDSATYLPPVSQGDVYRAAQDRPDAIAIVDGYFERVPAVWHKEILWAMKQGIPVYGASSMGALRATELAAFGMVGVGVIFETFRDGLLEDDDEVTIVHGEAETGYRAASTAMVDIRASLALSLEQGIVTELACETLLRIAKALFYPDRSWPRLLHDARTSAALPESELDALQSWIREGNTVSQKRADAIAMLELIRERHANPSTPMAVSYHFEHTDVWEQVVTRNNRHAINGELPSPALLEELQLHRKAYEQAMTGAFARALALAEADRQRIKPNATLAGEAITTLRRRHALIEPDSLERWIGEQELDTPGFREFILREARIHRVHTLSAPELAGQIPDWLRTSGRYGALARRALDKHRWLTQQGLEHPALAGAPVDEATLLQWFFQHRNGEPVPVRLDLHAHAAGFSGVPAFLQAVLREYYYVTQSGCE